MSFHLKIYDFFHYQEEDETYDYGDFATLEEATQAAKKVVQDFIFHSFNLGTSIDQLFKEFSMFGEDPVIISSAPNSETPLVSDFSSLTYAKFLIAELEKAYSPNQIALADLHQKVLLFAAQKHNSQHLTDSELPYLVHLSNVANEILTTPNLPYSLLLPIALLHDTLEDTNTTFSELESEFGLLVALGVQALTKNSNLPSSEKMQDSLTRLKKLPKDIWTAKLADRIVNLQKPPTSWTPEKIQAYKQEAQLILAELGDSNTPLAERLAQKIQNYIL